MRPLKSLISLDEAKKIINENIKQIDRKERISIENSYGRILASDIRAEFD
ncbi:molybdopterin molybdenumtransferase MoeA, partial [Thermococci archaeon]